MVSLKPLVFLHGSPAVGKKPFAQIRKENGKPQWKEKAGLADFLPCLSTVHHGIGGWRCVAVGSRLVSERLRDRAARTPICSSISAGKAAHQTV